ncbi:glycosyltransferase family 2 protein [Spirosoma validum]|uniref:Glycosyltransferase family 2 protein n=1 Tax=Spirosoma validum TaxID=2771355 RepID=A0A927B0R7_9BACT|nr:glycosyltransferase family 2 protein [Spirosoma validum]MBD2753300.1 glycosyltransferase family 2 protein [Spirosoma validum]
MNSNFLLDLTIAVPVRNEEQNLPECLTAIGTDLARQVVVIDSRSTDNTVDVAKSYGAEVIHFDWDGKFPKKRNWYLRNHTPTTKWVMFLDADEVLTEEFKADLRETLQRDENKVGYWLRYTIYFLGKQNKGGYFLHKLALFQVDAGEYERIDEDQWSQLDMEIHEHPVLNGEIGMIRSKIDHKDLRGVSYYVAKHNEYSSWEAARFLKLSKDTQTVQRWSWMQKVKYGLMQTPLLGPIYFLGSFFLMGGFRDGTRGFAFAILKMAYFTQTYLKIRELKQAEKASLTSERARQVESI